MCDWDYSKVTFLIPKSNINRFQTINTHLSRHPHHALMFGASCHALRCLYQVMKPPFFFLIFLRGRVDHFQCISMVITRLCDIHVSHTSIVRMCCTKMPHHYEYHFNLCSFLHPSFRQQKARIQVRDQTSCN